MKQVTINFLDRSFVISYSETPRSDEDVAYTIFNDNVHLAEHLVFPVEFFYSKSEEAVKVGYENLTVEGKNLLKNIIQNILKATDNIEIQQEL